MQFVKVGHIAGVSGLAGAMKITPVTDYPEIFDSMDYMLLAKDKEPVKSLQVEWVKPQGGGFLVKAKDINDLESAKQLRSLNVVVAEDMLPEISDEEVYWYKIEGSDVIDNIKGEKLGVLDDYVETGATDAFSIKLNNGKYALISNNKNHVIKIDPENRVVIIAPEGLVGEDL